MEEKKQPLFAGDEIPCVENSRESAQQILELTSDYC